MEEGRMKEEIIEESMQHSYVAKVGSHKEKKSQPQSKA